MKNFLYFFTLSLFVFSCSKEQNIDLSQDVELRQKEKVDLCHYDEDNNSWHLINVSVNAMDAHLAHGDVLLVDADGDGWVAAENNCVPGGDCDDNNPNVNPGSDEICDNDIDDNCDGNISEDCCPFFTVDQIIDLMPAQFWNSTTDSPCFIDDPTLNFRGPGNMGVSYDVDIYGDIVVWYFDWGDGIEMFPTPQPIEVADACWEVLLAAQAILNLPPPCDFTFTNEKTGNSAGLPVVDSEISK